MYGSGHSLSLQKWRVPFSLDGVAGAGVGGASIRMKLANASMSEMTAVFELPVVAEAVREVERVLRRGVEETARRFVALLREKLVRDSHLDVVGLAREHEKRLVLRLPSESGNGPIVCAEVHVSAR